MKSHYVPKMYLKGWQTVHNNRQGQICVYKKGQKPEFKSIKEEAGIREDYYSEKAEKWLDRVIENKTAPILSKVIQQAMWTSAEKLRLSKFMYVLWFRVPFNIDGLFKDVREKITMPDTVREMENFLDELKGLGLEVPDGAFDFEKMLKSPEHNKEVYSQVLMQNKRNQHSVFATMHWKLYRAAIGKEFVTSDNPVFYDRQIGLRNPAAYFIFPVSKDLLLEGRRTREPGNYYEQINVSKTDDLNREVIKNCDDHVYASINDPYINQMVGDCAGDAASNKHEINVKYMSQFI